MMTKAEVIAEIQKAAKVEGIDPELFQAICQTESSLEPYAIRFEPGYKWTLDVKRFASMSHISEDTERVLQSMSYGLCQIMGAVLREYGFSGRLQTAMVNPALPLAYGAKHLKKFLVRYKTMEEAIAAYNAGSPRYDAAGKFKNQKYVDTVLDHLQKLRALA